MKRISLIVLSTLLLTTPALAGAKLSGTLDITHASGQDSSNAAVTAVAAGGASYTHRVYKIQYRVDGADTVTLSCGTTSSSKSVYTFGAEGGIVTTFYPFYIECDTNTAITLTKGSAGTLLEYDIWYQKERN